jgi:hypothetical protein
MHRPGVVRLQLRVVVEDFLLCHASGEPAQYVPYRGATRGHTTGRSVRQDRSRCGRSCLKHVTGPATQRLREPVSSSPLLDLSPATPRSQKFLTDSITTYAVFHSFPAPRLLHSNRTHRGSAPPAPAGLLDFAPRRDLASFRMPAHTPPPATNVNAIRHLPAPSPIPIWLRIVILNLRPSRFAGAPSQRPPAHALSLQLNIVHRTRIFP